ISKRDWSSDVCSSDLNLVSGDGLTTLRELSQDVWATFDQDAGAAAGIRSLLPLLRTRAFQLRQRSARRQCIDSVFLVSKQRHELVSNMLSRDMHCTNRGVQRIDIVEIQLFRHLLH